MKSERVAVYCGTRNMYRRMNVIARSAVINGAADRVVFLTEDDTFPEPVPACVEIRNVSGQTFFRKDGPNYNTRWTWMVLMRAAITKLLPEYDRVLSLDTDTLVLRPADGLWDTEMDSAYVAATREKTGMRVDRPRYNRDPYFNAGVMLMNLKKLREDGKDDEIIGMLNRERLQYPDQDAINIACYGKIAELDPIYGTIASFYPELAEKAVIRHYCVPTEMVQATHEYNRFRRMGWDEALRARREAGENDRKVTEEK